MIEYIHRGDFMKNTTLCYIEKNGSYLMLHRVKKVNDENKDKWIGIGGKFEAGETPFDCVRRECLEETGAIPSNLKYRGVITFVSNLFGTEYMHLFYAKDDGFTPSGECSEGELCWVEKSRIGELNLWEGDMIFLSAMEKETPFFSLKLVYEGDKLVSHEIEYV